MDHRLSRSDLDGVTGFDRLQAFHEAALPSLMDGNTDQLTPGMLALTVLFVTGGEVDNGGFAALLYNGSAEYLPLAIEAAGRIGASGHAAAFRDFHQLVFDGGEIPGFAELEDMPEDFDDATADAIEALEDRFYALPDLDDALDAYVAANPDEFFRD